MDPALDAYMLSTSEELNESPPHYNANPADALIPKSTPNQFSRPEESINQEVLHNNQRRGLVSRPRNHLGLEGHMDLERPDSINQQSFHIPQSPKAGPRHNLQLEGDLDLLRPDSINQQSLQVLKSPKQRPRNNLGIEGHMDLDRPDSINAQPFQGQRRTKVKPTDNFGLEGHMDLERSHSINQQVHQIRKSPRLKPKDHLGLSGELDLSRPSSPNFPVKRVEKAKPKDNFHLEGQMEMSRKDYWTFDANRKGHSQRPLDTLSLSGSLDFTAKDLQSLDRCEIKAPKKKQPRDTISLPSATGMEYQRRSNIYEAYDGTSRPLRIKPKDTLVLEDPRESPSSFSSASASRGT